MERYYDDEITNWIYGLGVQYDAIFALVNEGDLEAAKHYCLPILDNLRAIETEVQHGLEFPTADDEPLEVIQVAVDNLLCSIYLMTHINGVDTSKGELMTDTLRDFIENPSE